MIKKINFIQYRRLKNPLELKFSPNVNVISGLNGTCKSSILHLISNAFQAETSRNLKLKETSNLALLNSLSERVNAKIETLTRGDKEYNNPAHERTGSLYSIHYQNGESLEFRRHNTTTDKKSRFRLIPSYNKNKKQKLPISRVIYLSISRLMPYGEISNKTKTRTRKKELPTEYNDMFHSLVKRVVGLEIRESQPEIVENIKIRSDYKTPIKGIDSNTSSAGEDNTIIILKNLVLLRFYYENLLDEYKLSPFPQSILLIDELDATLHPALQLKLFNVLIEYSEKYKIQIFFTTHSLYLLEKILQSKQATVNYLVHQDDHVSLLPNPSKMSIEAHLSETQSTDYIQTNKIPIFSEDEETRLFIRALFGYFRTKCSYFKKIEPYFHMVNVNLGCNNLTNLFQETVLDRNLMNAICILDGDAKNKKCTKRNIIVLPGEKSPEELIFDFISEIIDDLQNNFWSRPGLTNKGLTKKFFREKIEPDLNRRTDSDQKKREINKKIFNVPEFKPFFEQVLYYWIETHHEKITEFYNSLKFCFRQTALLNNIDFDLWPNETQLGTQSIPEYN